MRAGGIRKRSAGRRSAAPISYFTRIFTKQSRAAGRLRFSPIRATRSTKKRSYAGSPTTSAVVRPDGTLLCYQPYGKEGLLIADIDIRAATGLWAARGRFGLSF